MVFRSRGPRVFFEKKGFLNTWQHLLCDGAWIFEWTHQQGRPHAHCVFDAVVTEALLVGTTGTPPPPPNPPTPSMEEKNVRNGQFYRRTVFQYPSDLPTFSALGF